MNLGDTFKNPWVLGGGALIGVVLMLRSGTAAAQTGAATPTNMSATVAMNSAIMGANIDIAKTNAQLGAQRYAADTTRQLAFFDYLKTVDNNNAIVTNQRVISQAGITNSLIQSSTAIIVDQSNNANRLSMSYEETARAQIAADAQVSVAKYQYKAQKAVSKNNLIGSIAGAVSNIAQSAMMGGI